MKIFILPGLTTVLIALFKEDKRKQNNQTSNPLTQLLTLAHGQFTKVNGQTTP